MRPFVDHRAPVERSCDRLARSVQLLGMAPSATTTASAPLASMTDVAQLRAAMSGWYTGQSTTMLIGLAVFVVAVIFLTRSVRRGA